MPPRVFVIDDEKCIRDSIKWYLEDLGYDVVTTSEPLECDVYQGHTCTHDNPCGHAIIIDHQMPKMTAIELIDLMAQRGCNGKIPHKLVITGNISQVDMERANNLGISVAQKPVDFSFIKVWLEHLPIVPINDIEPVV